VGDVGWPEVIGAGVAVVGLVATIVKAIVKPHTDKIANHDERLHSLEKDTATKGDLTEHSRTIIKAIADGNSDIITRIGAVDRKADEAHKRINEQQQDELNRLRAEARGHGA
jgi:hypothetical protein